MARLRKVHLLDSLVTDGCFKTCLFHCGSLLPPSRARAHHWCLSNICRGHHIANTWMHPQNALDAYPPGHQSYRKFLEIWKTDIPNPIEAGLYIPVIHSKEALPVYKGLLPCGRRAQPKPIAQSQRYQTSLFSRFSTLIFPIDRTLWAKSRRTAL